MLKDGLYFVLNRNKNFSILKFILFYKNFRAFDVELLYIAQRLNIDIAEVSVNWTEIDGSKVTPIWSWLQMGRDLFLIWLRYRIGAWKLRRTD